MTAKTIMSSELVMVTSDLSVAAVLLEMSRHRVHNIPVVEPDGSFVGLISLRRLTHALLPTAAQVDAESYRMELGFLTEASDEYLKRLLKIGQRPVTALLEKKKKLRFCSPDTPIPRLLQLLYDNPTSLPVLVMEGDQKRLVGMVSNWDVLTKIAVKLLPESKSDQAREASAVESGTEIQDR